jgi:uncharacterized protein YjiS (DUF1127 family)
MDAASVPSTPAAGARRSYWPHPTWNVKIVLVITSDFPGFEQPDKAIGDLEAAMNISTHDVQRAHRGGLNQVLADWWQHLRSRHELESLDDTILRDIGLSRREERFEPSKPFWMN